ncbi:MAG: hypothetical protein WC929_07235 [Bacilli bacterium]|jgi:L-lactate permease
MLLNIVSMIGFTISIFIIVGLNRWKNSLECLKILAFILLVFTIAKYIVLNMFYEFSIPIEI